MKTVYRADDGTITESKLEAHRLDALHKLGEEYSIHKLYGIAEDCSIEWTDFLEWLEDTDHQTIVKSIIALI